MPRRESSHPLIFGSASGTVWRRRNDRPRLGVSWDMTGQGRMVLHSSAGYFHQARLGVDQLGAGLGDVGGVDAGETADLDVLGGEEFLPVERRVDLRPAVALGHWLEPVRIAHAEPAGRPLPQRR